MRTYEDIEHLDLPVEWGEPDGDLPFDTEEIFQEDDPFHYANNCVRCGVEIKGLCSYCSSCDYSLEVKEAAEEEYLANQASLDTEHLENMIAKGKHLSRGWIRSLIY